MAIDYDAIQRAGGIGKGKPISVMREETKAEWQKIDERESRKVRKRSEGRCEVAIQGVRCPRRAFEVHHHMGGIGVRGRGESALMKNKTHCCPDHHGRITSKKLAHISGNRYRERVA